MQIQAFILGMLIILTQFFYEAKDDYKPDRPNKDREHTFEAPRGLITNLGGDKSLLTLPDGREWEISYQPPGYYTDVRVKHNSFRGGTIQMKGDCSEKKFSFLDLSHCN